MSRRAPSDNREVASREVVWMRRAVALAAGSQPHPNPRVGALVLTPAGAEIGAAFHRSPGTSHAEVLALAQAGEAAFGATVVTTLEPCAHHGRTPPCTDALIAAGIAKVVVGAMDPDRQVAGRGVARLIDAGIEVVTGVAESDVIALDPGYFFHRRSGMPRIRLKLAATLDGQIAGRDGTSQWITSPEARRDAHQLRALADAVVIGAGTLFADDPRLDVRLVNFQGRQPRAVVVAGARDFPGVRQLYERSPLIYAQTNGRSIEGAEVVVAPGPSGVDLVAMAKDLAARGLIEVLVEGGPRIATSLLEAGLVDELTVYFGAKVAGGTGIPMFASILTGIDAAIDVDLHSVTRIGPDLRIDAKVREARS